MSRPLWRIFLTLFVGAFALQRGVVAGVFVAGGAWVGPESARVLAVVHGAEAIAGAVAALGIWLGHRWVLVALGVLGTTVAASGLLEAFHAGVRSPFAAVSQAMAAAVFTGGLIFLLNREFDDGAGPSGDRMSVGAEAGAGEGSSGGGRESRDPRAYPEPSMYNSP